MNKYFVYYSLTNNGEEVAKLMKDKGYTLVKIETYKPLKKKVGFFQMIKLGGTTISKKGMRICSVDLSLNDDDIVVVGTPIWNDRISSPMKSFLNTFLLNKETTKFILYSGGGDAKHAIKQISEYGYKEKPLLLKAVTKNLDKVKKELEKF